MAVLNPKVLSACKHTEAKDNIFVSPPERQNKLQVYIFTAYVMLTLYDDGDCQI